MALNSKSLRVAGAVFFAVNGVGLSAKANMELGYGVEQRTAVVGMDGVHGYKAEFQVAFIQVTITNRADLDVKQLLNAEDVTVTAQALGGKTWVLRNAWQAGPGVLNMDEGEIVLRFEGLALEEV